jgi:D-alanyl-D-alanine carboxypeptidase (penicillin-binding protein 5/6)
MVGSASRHGRRLIVVVNGLRTAQERATEARKLLDFGFRQFQSYELFGTNETVGDARVWGGTSSWVRLVARVPVRVLLSEQEKPSARTEIVYHGPLIAPVSEGQEVGFLRLTIDGKVVSRVPLITGANVLPTPDRWRKALDSVMFMAFGG